MFLRAVVLHAIAGAGRAEPGGGGHVEPVQQALEQAGTEGIARAGGVGHALGPGDAHGALFPVVDDRSLLAQRGDQPAGHGAQFGAGAARGLGDHFQLVIVGHQQGRALNGVKQLVAGKRGNLLAGIVDIPDALFPEEARQSLHVVEVAGRDDAPVGGGVGAGKGVTAGELHGRRMKAVDLVVVLVRDQGAARRELVGHHADAFQRQAQRAQIVAVIREILAHRGEDERLLAHERQRIGDVPGAAAALFHQPVDEEAHVQDVQLVGEDMIGKRAVKGHDTVKGHRTGHIDGHYSSGCVDAVIHARKSASPRSMGRATMQGVS